ncbi:MAG: carbohydrate ABC transporter permease [Caldilineaceae bacterium SB0662_bin_9]|uniref:Carbohydrate ABC transporter permease n=1 Tax=Caldilineaceae bacterium SB0662_bin_9 TaxID=2605258 RepID=A0A6B1DPA1_9CHLR|nr:carbohydrate ABC transporter permease [Caldilineaceae bacterium SB0662_bin_9]
MTVQGATAHHAVPERNWGPILHKVFVYTCLVVGTVVIMIPFFWMITTSLKKSGTEFTFPIEWLPNPPRWKNYVDGWTVLPFNRWALNSVRISALAIAGSVISSAIVGFGFGRIRFPGRDALFLLVLATMMLPFPSVIVPLFLLFKRIGWIDTILPLTVPTFFGANAFFIFLLRQFFRTLPLDLDDAARVDGCNTFHVFLRICLPLIRPALGIIFVFSFMHNWNDFLGPLIFLSHTTKYTLALGLRYFQSQYRVEWALMMAVSLIILTPNIVLFFLAQKYYIQGIVVSGVKG